MANKDDERSVSQAGFAELIDETRAASEGVPSELQSGPLGKIVFDPLPSHARPQVRVVRGRDKGQSFVISKSMNLIGRGKGVTDITLTDDAASRHHAVIAYQRGEFVLYDLGSTNGTYVDGRRADRTTLREGHCITIAETELVFSRPDLSASGRASDIAEMDDSRTEVDPVSPWGATDAPPKNKR